MDLHEKINNMVPSYFEKIITQYDFQSIKVSEVTTALYKNNFALVIGIDRFNADLTYVYRDKDNRIIKLFCDGFFAERYYDPDRKHLSELSTIKDYIINDLVIICDGMLKTWKNVLEGKQDWISDYKLSEWYGAIVLSGKEREFFDSILSVE